jgi:DNA repair protein RecN (Recombination protein N)
MLTELRIQDLGVIAELSLVLGPGMTVLTGETGAGKTMVVEALDLLLGGRADATLVRPGSSEAVVEGRFELDGDELVLARVVPVDGRSRAYVDGRLATAATLAELGTRLVDLHGQHAHQSLLSPAQQRAALDRSAGIDFTELAGARAAIAAIDSALAALGGDARSRAREIDLLRYQVDEIAKVAPDGPEEDHDLEREAVVLGDALAHREAAARAVIALAEEGGALDGLRTALAAVQGREAFAAASERLHAAAVELDDVAAWLRDAGEAIDDDPERLFWIGERRALLRELRRKYGDSLADVLAFHAEASERLRELEGYEDRAASLEAERVAALVDEASAAEAVARARRAAAAPLAAAVQAHLRELAMPRARIEVVVDGPAPSDDVTFLLGANPGEPALPLAKVASGGELARTMLALRLVLTEAPDTLVFDEVDAGVGGEAALSVGRALGALGRRHQVLVVTHLPQVAAFADAQIVVTKHTKGGRTEATAEAVGGEDRLRELSRMLSGLSASDSARTHAGELLAAAAAARERGA